MNNGIADLLTAINLRDRTAAENLINNLTAKQVDDFLRSKENGKTILDHVIIKIRRSKIILMFYPGIYGQFIGCRIYFAEEISKQSH
jgi:hypothetical protein